MTADWRAGFLAMSAILGVSVDEALASMAGAEPFAGTPLVHRLRSGTRDARARALAEVLAKVVAALDGRSPAFPEPGRDLKRRSPA